MAARDDCRGCREGRGRRRRAGSSPTALARLVPERSASATRQPRLTASRDQVARAPGPGDQPADLGAIGRPKEERGKKPRRAHEPDASKAADLDAGSARGWRCSTASSRCRPSPRASSPPRSSCRWRSVETELPATTRRYAVETKEVERRGVELVLATERALGRTPVEQAFNNPGFDILSTSPTASDPIRIEVKARIAGAEDFFVTHNEVLTALNSAPPATGSRSCASTRDGPRARRGPLSREPVHAASTPATSTPPAIAATGTRPGRDEAVLSR